MFVFGQFFTGRRAMKEVVEAAKKLEKNPNPSVAEQRSFLQSVSNAFRPGQAVAQTVEEGVSDTSDQIQSLVENANLPTTVNQGIGQITNPITNVTPAEVNTEVGNIDVTDPAVAATLGLSPSDAAIAGRQIRRSNLMRQTP
jgi:hypothetical protein